MWDSITSWAQSLTDGCTPDCRCECDVDCASHHEPVRGRDLVHIYDPEQPSVLLLDQTVNPCDTPSDQISHKLLGSFHRRSACKRRRLDPDSLGPADPYETDPHESHLSGTPGFRNMSSSQSSTTTPVKKRRAAHITDDSDAIPDGPARDGDHDDTPRAAHLARPAAYLARSISSPTRSSSTASRRSGSVSATSSSSARIKFVKLPLGNEGIVKRQFSGPPTNPAHPIATQGMLSTISSLGRCKRVLSPTLRNLPCLDSFLHDFDLDDSVFAPADQPASRLTPAEAQKIEDNARRCFEMDHDEPAWNTEVHSRLLEYVLRGGSSSRWQPDTHLCDFSVCTTASIIKDYVPIGIAAKRIDFCIYLNPEADLKTADFTSKMLSLRRTLPGSSLNHTSYGALCPHPISVGLETKRPGHDLDGAVLQIGVWQASQWKMLRRELRRTAPDRLAQQGVESPTVDDVERNVQLALSELGALHGVVIQGHDWIYVATSPEEPLDQDSLNQPELLASSRTILWLGKRFGDTNSTLGIHQIAAFLEHLALWSKHTYWPWFKRWILAS